MFALTWLIPTVAVVATIASGRFNVTYAALAGMVTAIPVATLTGPTSPDLHQIFVAIARGGWIGTIIAPYILGGLLFWQVAMPSTHAGATETSSNPTGADSVPRRRLLFFAVFLVGPFAESATGFGVGMLGTVMLLRRFSIPALPLAVFAMLSQTFIPWGAMGSGTILAAAYARLPASDLALYSLVLVAALMLVWLPLFWRTATQAGFGAPPAECAREIAWLTIALCLLGIATAYLGPETALLAAFGPLIATRYLIDSRPKSHTIILLARRVFPYVALISFLMVTRLVPGIRATLVNFANMTPFPDLPTWSPLFHAGSWLLGGAVFLICIRKGPSRIVTEFSVAWQMGKHAVMTVFLFATMAEVLSIAGISGAFADRLLSSLSSGAILVAPVVAGVFGILANSGNAPNSLFMPSQIALAVQAGLSIPAVAALQHVCGTSMSFFSPVRMSIAANLAGSPIGERRMYVLLAPYLISCFALMMIAAMLVVLVAS